MSKTWLLVVLMAVVPLASWASSCVDFQNLHGKAYDARDVIATKGFDKNSIPGGTMFAGKFSGPASYTAIKVNDIYQFTLNGPVAGMWMAGKLATGNVALNLSSTRGCPTCLHFSGAGVDIALPVPEPGTLSLLGAGLVVLASVVRRRRSHI